MLRVNPHTNGQRPLSSEPPANAALLVGHNDSAAMCGVSVASWHRLLAAGKIGPLPIRLGGRVLFSTSELSAWVEMGCPDRAEWQVRRQADRGRPA